MNFWIRNGIFAIVLAALAYLLLANQEFLMSLGQGSDTTSSSTSEVEQAAADQPPAIDKAPEKKRTSPASKNKAAEGLSTFYANLRGLDEDDEDGLKIRENVVYLPEPRGNLEKLLQAKEMVTRPLRKNWQGSVENRPFRAGHTLLQKLIEYAEQDGLDIIWRLNRDLIIKDPFRINKDILQTAYMIGAAISGHFPEGVDVYFCYKQRTIVFQSGPSEYMAKECRLLTSKAPVSNTRPY